MLKNIDPLLSPDALKILSEMGHGDEVVVVDANFTARTLGADKYIVRLDGVSLLRACEAVLSVFPLDAGVQQPIGFMKVCNTPEGYTSDVQQEVLNHIHTHSIARAEQCQAIERFAFYQRAKNAFAFIVTGELRPYGNFIFTKGVLTFAAS